MSNATITPTDLAAITGTDRHYFRIADSDAFECTCCKRPLQAAYESFSTPTGIGSMDRNGIASFCVPCIMKGGRQTVLDGVRSMVKEQLANDDTEAWEPELWNAVLDQFEMGHFEIQTPANEYDLVLAITEATAKHANEQSAATVGLIRNLNVGAGKLLADLKEDVIEASALLASLQKITSTP